MRLQFKVQPYQTDAVEAVVDCFAGQPRLDPVSYRIDPGRSAQLRLGDDSGLRNAEIVLSPVALLDNIRTVQRRRNLPLSSALVPSPAAPTPNTPNLDVEMETGTGKTYVYIKTIMELNRRYGWSKFIVVVPSVAIREGVRQSFDLTAEHFQQTYGTRARCFVYNSARLHELERFSSDGGIQVMIINTQAFNATGRENRRIYEELEDFQSRRPIDVIRANRPIVIIDEPQRIGARSLAALAQFDALMILRYSATHRTEHNKVYRLDALDAYNQKLVKRIAVRGISVRGLAGSTPYLYLEAIEVAPGAPPSARIELEVRTRSSITRQVRRLGPGADLYEASGRLAAYRGLRITDIDARRDRVELSNGDAIVAGEVTADVTEETKRRIQIREVIRAHLDKERELYAQGIKVLSLFFIDEVAKYRDYERADTLGEYARVFVAEYQALVAEVLDRPPLDPAEAAYHRYLAEIPVERTHQGYFSVDRRTRRLVDPGVPTRGEDAGESTDVDAYDLILRDKERLLSFDEPVRFIFSHSALREGWDNPNVFVMGMLKRSDSTISRRQEIGRGLRLAVDQHGERVDNPVIVHQVNELTVVTDESYTQFVAGLQREIVESLAARPRRVTIASFVGKTYVTDTGEKVVSEALATALYNYLVRHNYVDDDGAVTDGYKAARDADDLAVPTSELLRPVAESLWPLVDAAYVTGDIVTDGRKAKRIPLNQANFEQPEFQELWSRINRKAVYQVAFDSDELVDACVAALDTHLAVTPMQYVVQAGAQRGDLGVEDLATGTGFAVTSLATYAENRPAPSRVSYDLLGELATRTQLTRRTVSAILGRVHPGTFAQYRQNPEQFIAEATRLINERKATLIVERVRYDLLTERHDAAIFTRHQARQDLTDAAAKLTRHIYDYVVPDSETERAFVAALEASEEVAVYAKLPRAFSIPTPVGEYTPDWAIAFKAGTVRSGYVVAETKGARSSMQLRGVEQAKIECARKFFAELNRRYPDSVRYEVVTDYDDLMRLAGAGA
jgi:type III restriction enzyme